MTSLQLIEILFPGDIFSAAMVACIETNEMALAVYLKVARLRDNFELSTTDKNVKAMEANPAFVWDALDACKKYSCAPPSWVLDYLCKAAEGLRRAPTPNDLRRKNAFELAVYQAGSHVQVLGKIPEITRSDRRNIRNDIADALGPETMDDTAARTLASIEKHIASSATKRMEALAKKAGEKNQIPPE